MDKKEIDENKKIYTIATYVLAIGSIITGISGLISLIMAYINRDEYKKSSYMYYTHLRYIIRQSWIFAILFVISLCTLPIFGVGIFVGLFASIYFLIKIIIGFKKLLDDEELSEEFITKYRF